MVACIRKVTYRRVIKRKKLSHLCTSVKSYCLLIDFNLDISMSPRSGRPITGKVDEIMMKRLSKHSHAISEELNSFFVNCKNSFKQFRRRMQKTARCFGDFNTEKFHESNLLKNWKSLIRWEVSMHPPYNSNIVPSDYHLFRSLQNSLNGVEFQRQKRPVKITCRSFSPRNHTKVVQRRDYGFTSKMAKSSNKTAHIWFNKLYVKYEKGLFRFCSKIWN